MTIKNVLGKCSLFVLSANGWKDQNMDSSFSRQRKPSMENTLFDWPIVLQYEVKAKYRLISRKFSGMKFFQPSLRLTNQKPRTFVFVSLYFRSFVVSVLFARFYFKVKRKSLYLCSRRILGALASERKYMKCLIFWTADKDMKVAAWMWSLQLNTQSKRLKRNRKKFRLDRELNPDLCDVWAYRCIH